MTVIGCDLDGVIWRGDEPVAGSSDAIAALRAAGHRVVFITNNSYATIDDYLDKLRRFAIDCDATDFVSSAIAGAALVGERCGATPRVLACAGPGVREAVASTGGQLVDEGPADAVVVGWHRDFNFESIRLAADAIRGGACFIATNDDPTYPGPGGSLLPGNGSLVAAVATAAGIAPVVAGKPHAPMARAVTQRCGTAGVMIGDRLSTDGAFAARLGWPFGLVQSGVAAADDVAPDSAAIAVTWTAADLAALVPQVLESVGRSARS